MRVYANKFILNLWAYAKLAAALALLFVVISQAMKIWEDEPAVQQIKEFTERIQPK
ncbi:MAG: hypothetical protein AAGE59_36675 [Cyanobacteria bacterium P01_F01_bin.86]